MIAAGDRAALDRLLGGPEMAWFLDRLPDRILAAGGAPMTGVVQLRDPQTGHRDAATRLVGRPKRSGATLRIDLDTVEEILRRGPWPAGLANAFETLRGPVTDRRAERERAAEAWDEARSGLTRAAARFPGLGEWWQGWCAAGGLKRSARAEADRCGSAYGPDVAARLVTQVADLLEVLPASGEPLAVLARRVLGDAHGLDRSRPLGRLAAVVVAAAFTPAGPFGSRSTRDAWASAGVVMSNVASTVLSVGVPGGRTSAGGVLAVATAAALEAMRAARAPIVLTLDQVRSGGVAALPGDAVVHVCENPTIVEVLANRWADEPHPSGGQPVLVCTWGQPSTAVVDLLRALTTGGAQCRYHGDFDWPGLRIAQALHLQVPWVPWRYTADDYRAALRDGAPSLSLVGAHAEAPWDPDLAAAMAEHGLAVEEEALADVLAGDVLDATPYASPTPLG